MRSTKCIPLIALVWFTMPAYADQYACESGVVDKAARAAAPPGSTVTVSGDRNAKSCQFSIGGEAVTSTNLTKQDAETKRNARSQAIDELKSGALGRGMGSEARDKIAILLFGTRDIPDSFRSIFSNTRAIDGMNDCISAFQHGMLSDSRRRDIFISTNREVTCGGTGTSESRSNAFSQGMITAFLYQPKLFLSLTSNSEQMIMFIAHRQN